MLFRSPGSDVADGVIKILGVTSGSGAKLAQIQANPGNYVVPLPGSTWDRSVFRNVSD